LDWVFFHRAHAASALRLVYRDVLAVFTALVGLVLAPEPDPPTGLVAILCKRTGIPPL